jgi:hypothetical protein
LRESASWITRVRVVGAPRTCALVELQQCFAQP